MVHQKVRLVFGFRNAEELPGLGQNLAELGIFLNRKLGGNATGIGTCQLENEHYLDAQSVLKRIKILPAFTEVSSKQHSNRFKR